MQSNIVKAFRQRLERDGYMGIRIIESGYSGLYTVICSCSDGRRVVCQLTEEEMQDLPRRVYFSAEDYKT